MTQAPPPASAMDAESRAVSALVDPAELVDLAGALIRIPSFKTEETPVARFLDGFFRARGYEVDLQEIEPGRFQTIATLRGTGGGALRRRPPGDRALGHRAPGDPRLRGDRPHRTPRGHRERGGQDDGGDRRARPRAVPARPAARPARVPAAQRGRHPGRARTGLRAG